MCPAPQLRLSDYVVDPRGLPCAMSAQISQHNGGGPPRSVGGAMPLVTGGGISHLVSGPQPLPSSSPFRSKHIIGTTMVKSEKNVDDGVDLSFDSSVKKENFELKVESIKVETDSHNPTSQTKPPMGGRLKFFKEGRVLLELTHRCVGDGEKQSWVPTGSKKVYWPPGPASLTSRLDSNASTNTITGSDGSGESGGYNSAPPMSPWGTPSPRPPSSWHPAPPHRVKAVPRRVTNAPEDLVFAMKPPQGVRNYRKKIRTFRRKCRQPGADIKIGLFILKMECQAVAPRIKRKIRPTVSAAQRIVKLDQLVSKLDARRSMVHVPINAWRTGRTDLAHLVKNPPSNPASPVGKGGGPGSPAGPPTHPHSVYRGSPVSSGKFPPMTPGTMRVKSELKMVTETCTSTITSVSSPPRHTHKVKAETRIVSAETRTVPVRSLPITPTVGRVKAEPGPGHLKSTAISLMSPEMARVRMEIGPASQDRDQSFVSPRKRYLRDYENGGGSPAKNRRLSTEHRLSTDSLGSTGDRSSPYRGPASPQPVSRPAPAAPGAKAPYSFSIDSLISGGGAPAVAPSSPSRLGLPPSRRESIGPFHPVARNPSRDGCVPGSPSRGGAPHMPLAPTPTRPSPTPAKSPPPQHPAFPFMYPHHPLLAQHLIDPRLAHLAALSQAAQSAAAAAALNPAAAAALNQAGGALNPYGLYPFSPYHLAASVSAASYVPTPTSGTPTVWTPPVATPTPPNSISSSQRETPTPTHTITSPTYPPLSTSMPTSSSVYAPTSAVPSTLSSSTTAPRPISPPRPLPPLSASGKIQEAHKHTESAHFKSVQSQSSDDAPLNLSMKPTAL